MECLSCLLHHGVSANYSLVGTPPVSTPAKVTFPFTIDFFIAGQDNLQDLSLNEWKMVPFLCGKCDWG